MTTPDPTCNSEGIHWDSNGKREIPCEVCDGTGEAGGGLLRKALVEALVALNVYRRGEGEYPDFDQWESKARAALNAPTESVKAPEGVTQQDREAAAALYPDNGYGQRAALSGKHDQTPLVQAFMRHRLAASPTPITADDAVAKERERLRDALEKIAALEVAPIISPNAAAKNGKQMLIAKAIARAAIRSLSPDTEGEGM